MKERDNRPRSVNAKTVRTRQLKVPPCTFPVTNVASCQSPPGDIGTDGLCVHMCGFVCVVACDYMHVVQTCVFFVLQSVCTVC